ncbi:hypothetical protein JTB14_001841 [Gonioctena quinquepunctata]|nr:hypothetical protein JTB14_001841 [Gonioctena quinquepunctata]
MLGLGNCEEEEQRENWKLSGFDASLGLKKIESESIQVIEAIRARLKRFLDEAELIVDIKQQTQPSPSYTLFLNLPENLKYQADVYELLTRSDVLGGNLENIKVNQNRTALVETIEPINIEVIRKKIRHIGGCPKIDVLDLRYNKERPQISNKMPSMSFVIKDVDKNLTDEKITKHFRDTGVEFVRLSRIVAIVRQQPTKMIRVITQDAETYSKKLAHGIHIFGLKHKCEKSNTPQAPLIMKYCSRCCKNGHEYTECKENMKCPFCRMQKNEGAKMSKLRGQPPGILHEMSNKGKSSQQIPKKPHRFCHQKTGNQ